MDKFSRLSSLIGTEKVTALKNKHVAIFGLGGVGGFVCEALVRSNIGEFSLIDNDVVDITNFNRQIIATNENLGKKKVDAMTERIMSINNDVKVHKYDLFFSSETTANIDLSNIDYIVDAIDSIDSKIALIKLAKENDIPIISSMGTARKMNPNDFIVCDISKTEMDPLARNLRLKLRKQGINHVKVVYSKEKPLECNRNALGSNSFVPSSAGLLIASEVIKDLIN
ncbi:MAG: tRNA threonylcarbamoyladenosine dehydratase [Bacilli bacterium]|nr:tRNA threonylcarbamoyladenosine dehydratase [Bacilli bacterium]